MFATIYIAANFVVGLCYLIIAGRLYYSLSKGNPAIAKSREVNIIYLILSCSIGLYLGYASLSLFNPNLLPTEGLIFYTISRGVGALPGIYLLFFAPTLPTRVVENFYYLTNTRHELAETNKKLEEANEKLEALVLERTAAYEALTASEQRFRLLIENASDIITIFDKDGTRLYISPSVKHILGYEPDSVIGKGLSALVEPDSIPPARLEFEQLQQDSNNSLRSDVFKVRHADGSIRYFESVMQNFLDDPRIKGIVSNSHDVTERVLSEIKAREDRDFALQILNTMGHGVTVSNSDSIIIYANQAYSRMLGYTTEELIGRSPFEFTHPEDIKVLEEIKEKREKGITNTYETRLLKKTGEIVHVSITGVPQFRDGKLENMVAVITDKTEQNAIEVERRRESQFLETLHQTTLALLNRLDSTELLESIITHAGNLLGIEEGSIFLFDPDKNELVQKVGIGMFKSRVGGTRKPGIGLIGQVFQLGKPLIIEDYNNWINRRNIPENEDLKSAIAVPLIIGERVIGVIGLANKNINRQITQQDLNMLQQFAQLATLVFANVELYTTSQRHISELNTLQKVMQAINSSLEIDEIMTLVVEHLCQTFGYQMVSFYELHENNLYLKKWIGYDHVLNVIPVTSGAIGRAARTGVTQYICNAEEDIDFLYAEPGINQGIFVPLKSRNNSLLGVMSVESDGIPFLRNEDVNLLTLLADQVSIAMENAHLVEELRQNEAKQRHQREVLATLHETTLALMNRLDLTELLETIALRATTLFGVSHCFIYLVEPGGEDIILKVGTGLYKDILSLRLKKGEGLSGKVWETGQTILIDNYGSWSGRYYGNDWEKPHAMVGIPLKSNSKVLGVIGLTSLEEGRSFSEDEIDLLQEFAQLAAIAVDNAELYTSTQRHLSELTTLQNVAKAINSTLKLNEFCRTVVEQMSNAFGYKMVSIYLISGNGLHLQAECGLGDIPTYCGLEFGVSGRVARTGIPAFLRDINADPDFVPLVSNTRQLIVMPLKAKEGQVIGTLGIGADREKVLTNEDFNLIGLLAEQVSIGISNANLFAKLSNSEEKYRYVVNNVNEIIFQTDSNGVLTFINSSWHDLSGYTIEESIGQPILKHVYPEDRKLILETFNKFREGALQEKSLEHRVVIRNDQIRWVYSFSSAIRDSNGYVTGVIGTVVDITERRKAEEERLLSERRMLESQRLESLGLLAGGIAHDFNNLLVSILGNSELALMEINKDAPLFDTIKQIEIASLRAADLTRQMLAYSGRGRFVMKTLDINEQAREIVQLLKSSISKRVSLEYKLTDSLPPIEADSGQIHQLIMNLVINAAEAIGDKDGKVIITSGIMYANCDYLSEANINPTATEGYFVYLEVEDNGTGMDADTVSRIFDPFFTTKFTGRGLGLSAVQGIVRGHNGALKIHSIVGNGTTFRVLFPASYNIFQPVNIIPQNNSTGSKNIRVLIIDDDDLLRKSTKRLLTQMGIEVFLASDGIEGLNTFLENHQDIDCILLDLTMPRLSGEETFHRLKEIDPDVRVIMMSGYSELEVSERFTGEYRVEFLQKPYTFQELKEKVVKAANSLYQ